MKTAEDIWDEHFDGWVMAAQIKRQAIPAMEEYAKLYHESEVKKLKQSVVRRSVCLHCNGIGRVKHIGSDFECPICHGDGKAN